MATAGNARAATARRASRRRHQARATRSRRSGRTWRRFVDRAPPIPNGALGFMAACAQGRGGMISETTHKNRGGRKRGA